MPTRFQLKISMPNFSNIRIVGSYTALCLALNFLLQGCALVHQKDREFLSDPILQKQADPLESRIESHDFPRREGSVGGSAGSGGGCGC